MRHEFHDPYGRLLGFLEDFPPGPVRGFFATGELAGHYDPLTDRTFDATGRLVGTGNQLTLLVGRPRECRHEGGT